MATLYPTIRVVDADGAPVTGDDGNLTLVVLTDGVAADYAGAVTEPTTGEYKVAVTQSGTLQAVTGVSSTEGAIVVPARWYNAATLTEEQIADLAEAISDEINIPAIGALTVTSGGSNIVDGLLRVEVPRGDSYSLVLEVTEDGGAVDLSAYDSFVFTVKPVAYRQDADDANAVFQVAGTLSGDGNNIVTVALSPDETEATDLQQWYDCDLEASDDERTLVRTVLRGSYRTTLDVTRGS